MEKVLLILSNGKKLWGSYDKDDFDGIYDDWEKGEVMAFLNCCVKGTEVIGMEYRDTPSDTSAPIPTLYTRHEINGEGKYEIFRDSSYYDMWCVRSKDDRRFNSPMSFHFAMKKDADEFKRLIEMAK